MSKIAQTTVQAMQLGVPAQVLQFAYNLLGKKAYEGYCQQFVEQMTGSGWKGSSAINAWNNTQNKIQGSQGLQPGDLVYFSANQGNNNNGHTGIYAGNNQFISATDNGIKQTDLNQWQSSTGQKLLGYIPQGQRQQQVTTPQQPVTRQKPSVFGSISQLMNPFDTQQSQQTPQSTIARKSFVLPNIEKQEGLTI